jgi:hypothetical protein
MFVQVAAVDECLLEQVEVADRESEPGRERGARTHRLGWRTTA